MDAFCRAIRWISLEAPCLGTIILKPRDDPDTKLQTFSDKTVKKEFRLRVEFRSTAYVPMSPTFEQTLVAVVADLRVPGQKVNLEGTTALLNTEQYLRATAGAPIIFITALVWDMVEIARIQMTTAHGLVNNGDYKRAAEHYWTLVETSKSRLIFSTPENIFASDSEEACVVLGRILIDAAAMYGFLKLRNLEIAEATKAEENTHGICGWLSGFHNRNEILGFSGQSRGTWYAASPAYHLQLLLQLQQDFGDLDALQSIWDCLNIARELCPGSMHLVHDIEIVAKLLSGDLTISVGEHAFMFTSACVMPPPIFDSQVPEQIKQPRMRGWIIEDQIDQV